MNREIKFRGKPIEGELPSGEKLHGGFVYGSLLQGNGLCQILVPVEGAFKNYKVDPDTVGQFTGLCDANGREIYEGDITKAPLLDPIFGDILSDAFDNVAISFHNGSFVVAYYEGRHKIYLQDLYNKIEVLGNIHDNPELLKGVEK